MLMIDSQLFAPISSYKIISTEQYIIFDPFEAFQKISFRNRYIIAGANGLITLSVPIKGGRQQRTILKDVRIGSENRWNIEHLKSIQSSYAKAPFFEYYFDGVRNLLERPPNFLLDLNMSVFEWTCPILNISAEYGLIAQINDQPVNDMRNKILPGNFKNSSWGSLPQYVQVFSSKFGFQTNLSVLDLIFCEGPNSGNLLRSSS